MFNATAGLTSSQSDKEIAGCISDIGVPCSPADLQKPNPQHIQIIFELIAELVMNATRDTIDPAMRAAAEDVCGDYIEIVPVDTRNLMGFFVSLRSMLVQCGIHDFSFSDLLRPTHDRLIKIFSYTINFIRFKESQCTVIDDNFGKSEATKARIENLYLENQDMGQRLEEMRRNRKAMESVGKEKAKRNDELKARLLELKDDQKRIAEQLEKVRSDKARSQTVLEEKTERLMRNRQESEKLRPYVLQSPAALQDSLLELSSKLSQDRGQIDDLERRTRALQTSGDTFISVQNDVQSCVKVLEEVSIELQKEEEEEARASKSREELAERTNEAKDIEDYEKQLQTQLRRWEERTEETRAKAKRKELDAQARMEKLKDIQQQLREERAEKDREMERRRMRIEQTEKKVGQIVCVC
jgi:kinetochore protein Nuf2